ncbi:MAG TPA: outer membrane protein assembly factor BamD, partial [Chthoniobacteraceae bacterium]|nr:outer membrane protein assembly factor BamD [Chthoniobacteraceae bacterium]
PLWAAALALPLAGQAAIIYRSNEGWSVEGDPNNTVEISAVDQMKKAEAQEASGKLADALASYRGLVHTYPTSLLAPKAQHKIGVLLEKTGDPDHAFNAYDTYLTKYPKGEDFDATVDSMFKIAKTFLEGQKKKIMGVPLGSNLARSQAMFEILVKRAAYSKWAPLAQFNVGQALEKQQKYPEAINAYQQVYTKYPNDAIADDALYQIGYVRLRQYRDGSYDRADANKARQSFEEFISRFPESEKVPQARENLKSLEGGQVKNALSIAKYYDKQKQYKAAVIYYNDVLQQQPGSADSEVAKTRIAQLKELVGEDSLRAGPEKAETGEKAAARRKLQARVDTVSRPDYVGPPVKLAQQPTAPVETAPGRPKLRTSSDTIGPVPPGAVEPPLPGKPEALKPETGLPVPQ